MRSALHGVTFPSTNELHALRGLGPGEGALRWERVRQQRPLPSPRAFHASAPFGSSILFFGGERLRRHEINYLSDVLCLRLPTFPLEEATTSLPSTASSADADAPLAAQRDSLDEMMFLDELCLGEMLGEDEGARPSAPHYAARSTGSAGLATGAMTRSAASWQHVVPDGFQTAPPSSLTTLCVVDSCLLIFGGFNNKSDASLSDIHVISLCPGLESCPSQQNSLVECS